MPGKGRGANLMFDLTGMQRAARRHWLSADVDPWLRREGQCGDTSLLSNPVEFDGIKPSR